MNSCQQNLSVGHCKVNNIHIKRFERFLKKNKLDNALVVTESGDVVDLYSGATVNIEIGLLAGIWMQICGQLAKVFYCIGNLFLKASNMASVWTRFCYKLSGNFNFIGSLLIRVGHFRS